MYIHVENHVPGSFLLSICAYVPTYKLYIYTHTYTYVYVYIHIYVYIYIYTHTHLKHFFPFLVRDTEFFIAIRSDRRTLLPRPCRRRGASRRFERSPEFFFESRDLGSWPFSLGGSPRFLGALLKGACQKRGVLSFCLGAGGPEGRKTQPVAARLGFARATFWRFLASAPSITALGWFQGPGKINQLAAMSFREPRPKVQLAAKGVAAWNLWDPKTRE